MILIYIYPVYIYLYVYGVCDTTLKERYRVEVAGDCAVRQPGRGIARERVHVCLNPGGG